MFLSNLIKIISGGTPKTNISNYWNGDIPWISIKDFINQNRYIYVTEKNITQSGLEHSATNILEKNDIIISARGTVGQVALLSKNMAFNQSCYGIRSNNNDLLQMYLYYWLFYNKNLFITGAHGAVFNTITKDDFDRINIDLPSLTTQQHIVDTIGSVDDLIEKNEEMIEKIEHYLLLKFSVHEKKDAKILISDFTKCYNGGAFKSKEYVLFSNKKLITIKNVDDNGFNASSVDYLNENIDNKYLLNIGDIIMTMTGNVGRVGIVSENNCYLNQRVLKIESICQVYLYCYLKKHILDIISLGRGTAQKNLSLIDFQNMTVFNTINEIKKFNNNASFLETIVKLKCKNIQLNKIKKQLLTKYFD